MAPTIVASTTYAVFGQQLYPNQWIVKFQEFSVKPDRTEVRILTADFWGKKAPWFTNCLTFNWIFFCERFGRVLGMPQSVRYVNFKRVTLEGLYHFGRIKILWLWILSKIFLLALDKFRTEPLLLMMQNQIMFNISRKTFEIHITNNYSTTVLTTIRSKLKRLFQTNLTTSYLLNNSNLIIVHPLTGEPNSKAIKSKVRKLFCLVDWFALNRN